MEYMYILLLWIGALLPGELDYDCQVYTAKYEILTCFTVQMSKYFLNQDTGEAKWLMIFMLRTNICQWGQRNQLNSKGKASVFLMTPLRDTHKLISF